MTPLQRKSIWVGSIAIVIAVALVVPGRRMKPESAEVTGSASANTTAPAVAGNPDAASATVAGMDPQPAPMGSPPPMAVAAAATAPPDRRAGLSYRPDTESFYPPESRSLGEEGTSRLRMCFDDLGRVTEVTLAASSGSERLDAAAVQMGWHYRFTTTVVNGVPVQHQCLLQPVRFTLRRDNTP